MGRHLFTAGLIALIAAVNAPLVHRFFLRGEAKTTVELPFRDDFGDRSAPGPAWTSRGGTWRVTKGELWAAGVKNNPLWLQARLPNDVTIRFRARSESDDGDLKFELFGDGRAHASGYVVILGGWKNTISTIARLDEHGADRVERRDFRVERGRTYAIELERRGRVLTVRVDGAELLSFDDPAPLAGPGHDRFAFSSWEADLFFDDLAIEPL